MWASNCVKTTIFRHAAHTNDVVRIAVTQLKWTKAKTYLRTLRMEIGTPTKPNLMNHKYLQQARGYFNHLGLAHNIIVPYLRGFHNTIDGWRDNRDIDW